MKKSMVAFLALTLVLSFGITGCGSTGKDAVDMTESAISVSSGDEGPEDIRTQIEAEVKEEVEKELEEASEEKSEADTSSAESAGQEKTLQDGASDNAADTNTVSSSQTAGSSSQEEAKEYTMPDLTGKSTNDALLVLTDYALDLTNVTYEFSNDYAADAVMGQTPVSGSIVKEGTQITLIVSKGKQSVSVPDVTGMSVSAATNTLISAGLNVDSVSDQGTGTVYAQNYMAGDSVVIGTTVTVYD